MSGEQPVRLLTILLCALPIAGCTTFGGGSKSDIESVPVAEDATGLMLTAHTPRQVADCIGQIYHTTPQPIAGGYSVSTTGKTILYRVLSFTDPLNRYATRVDIIGGPAISETVPLCLAPAAPA